MTEKIVIFLYKLVLGVGTLAVIVGVSAMSINLVYTLYKAYGISAILGAILTLILAYFIGKKMFEMI